MTLVVDKFRSLLPVRTKTNASGWISFNAPCCVHRGHRPDTRSRGGVRFDNEIVYYCFNCKFSASWQPGRTVSERFKTLARWLGATDYDINTLLFESLKTESPDFVYKKPEQLAFSAKQLPNSSMPLLTAIEQYPQEALPVVEYLLNRNIDLASYEYFWSCELPDRAIVPFYYKKQLCGYTARRITDSKPKYLSSYDKHFVFNIDSQLEDQRYLFVVEGPFDAISIGGVALLTNDVSEQQANLISGLGHTVIVVPDQDQAGLVLVDRAIENGWAVAFPNWEDDVKDPADAVSRYGKLFVVVDCIMTAVSGEIKIKVARDELARKIKKVKYKKMLKQEI